MWRSIPNFKHKSDVTTWLYRVALNTAFRWNRNEKMHPAGRQTFDDKEHLLHKYEPQQDERLIWLYEEITKLNEIDRSPCLLMLDGFKYQEMADILGITESNVGIKIHRIKKCLITKSQNIKPHGI